jgi:hypothetical protein
MEILAASKAGSALALLALGAVLAERPGEARAEGIFSAEGAVLYDSNLPRALSDADIVGDTALKLAVSGGFQYALGDRDTAGLTADLLASQFRRFYGMNSVALGGTASWGRKFGLGAFVPWTKVSASFAGEQYSESIRNGLRSNVMLRAGQRLSERLELSGSGSFERYRADDVVNVVPGLSGDAFSLLGRSVFARADYALNERWAAFASVAFRRGDVTASTRLNPVIFAYSNAVTPDPVFGPDYFAYRLSGTTTWDFIAGASLAISDYSSVNLAVTRALTYASGGVEYQSTRINASIILSY